MKLDLLLIKLFLNDLKLYEKYKRYLTIKSNNLYAKLYQALSTFGAAGETTTTVETFALRFHALYPVLSPTDSEQLAECMDSLKAMAVPANAEEILEKIKHRSNASEIALLAVEVVADEKSFSELLNKLKEIDEEPTDEVEADFVTDDIVEITDRHRIEPPFKFRLNTLNRIFGGVHRRTFGFIFARPEIGKTQLVVSEATFLAEQVPGCVLWVNNEEDGYALVTRTYQAALRKQSHEILANPQKAREAYQAKLSGKIKLYDRPNATTRDIERLVREYRPDVVFIDQLDKVRGVTADRYDLLQKALYQWARELGKKYNCAVIGVCQAGGTAEGKRYLDMNDVDSSHTAKQGEADWMFGLGASDRIGEEDRRFISVCKNKLPVSELMVPSMRHAKIPIRTIPEIQIYEDVINVS